MIAPIILLTVYAARYIIKDLIKDYREGRLFEQRLDERIQKGIEKALAEIEARKLSKIEMQAQKESEMQEKLKQMINKALQEKEIQNQNSQGLRYNGTDVDSSLFLNPLNAHQSKLASTNGQRSSSIFSLETQSTRNTPRRNSTNSTVSNHRSRVSF
ncbi:hypothetical protein V1387_18335 [Allomuricauda taeanensis]|uniref:hypothetical protein n=1 Tax=Flagellimonas taeanensis TaxID=1005926 RepID=UPI002E7B461D|nr:hypothetical protein [Allomuricauda taeanensis]MEE1964644.1 hypothetical protein [Allomuricauda taeanensis]